MFHPIHDYNIDSTSLVCMANFRLYSTFLRHRINPLVRVFIFFYNFILKHEKLNLYHLNESVISIYVKGMIHCK